MPEGRFSTAANYLSIARVPLSAAASVFIYRGMPVPAGVLAVIAVSTDWLDGFIARRTGTVSDWGKILDPLADKISYGLFALALVLSGALAPWFLFVLILRDVLIGAGGLFLAAGSSPPGARTSGKISTLLVSVFLLRQAFFPGALLTGVLPGADLVGALALGAVVLSFFDYACLFFRRLDGEPRECS